MLFHDAAIIISNRVALLEFACYFVVLEELDQFRRIQRGNARDIEEFADLLYIAMINLKGWAPPCGG